MPSHYLNQCWNIVDGTLRNKLQWNCNWNSNSSIPENAFESVVCKMVAILSLPQCVKQEHWYRCREALQHIYLPMTLQWCHNGCDGISNHQPHDYSTVYSGSDQRKHQSSASLAFVRGIHWWPVNSLQKWPVMRKMFPFDDVIMKMEKSNAVFTSWCYVLPVTGRFPSLKASNVNLFCS